MHHFIPFTDEEHERAWLIRITVNRCYDLLRYKSKRNHEALDEITEMAAEEKELNTEIFQILEKLPVKNKTAMILHYLEGFSVDEVSRTLGISLSATKMRLSRGRELLKNLITTDEEKSNV